MKNIRVEQRMATTEASCIQKFLYTEKFLW